MSGAALEPTAALLIDFENFCISREKACETGSYDRDSLEEDIKKLDAMCARLVPDRRIIVRRAYANFYARHQSVMSAAPSILMEHGVDPIQVYAPGKDPKKSASDMRLAMEASSLLSSGGGVKTFLLVTGDSDFVSVVRELRRHGSEVVGIGVSGCISKILVRYCDRFQVFEDFDLNAAPDTARAQPARRSRPTKTRRKKRESTEA